MNTSVGFLASAFLVSLNFNIVVKTETRTRFTTLDSRKKALESCKMLTRCAERYLGYGFTSWEVSGKEYSNAF